MSAFSENPARKLMSLMIGATLGVIVAGFMGLNLFLAVSVQVAEDASDPGEQEQDVAAAATDGFLYGTAGILLTGIVVGLGASPTHAIIKGFERRQRGEVVVGGSDESVASAVGPRTALSPAFGTARRVRGTR